MEETLPATVSKYHRIYVTFNRGRIIFKNNEISVELTETHNHIRDPDLFYFIYFRLLVDLPMPLQPDPLRTGFVLRGGFRVVEICQELLRSLGLGQAQPNYPRRTKIGLPIRHGPY